jgi:predicted site-specific integrase-resolvase
VISDAGSGVNYHKKGLRRLLNDIMNDRVGRLVIAHKDQLLRFGAELVFAVCEEKNVELVILNQGEDAMFGEDLAGDVLDIINTFIARLYGPKSKVNRKLLEAVMKTIEEASR